MRAICVSVVCPTMISADYGIDDFVDSSAQVLNHCLVTESQDPYAFFVQFNLPEGEGSLCEIFTSHVIAVRFRGTNA